MPTSRTLSILLACLAMTGCAADASDGADDGDVAEAEGEIGASPKSAGITSGSADEEGVLLLVNDRAVTIDTLKARTKLTVPVAKSITAFRTAADGKPRWFSTVDEIDALPATGKVAFQRLVADAKASGYTEVAGFDPPTLAKISVPPNLGRPPTSNDVTVEAGFDGKPAAEAAILVRGRLTNTVDSSNEGFVRRTIADNHKAFTLAVGNFFAQGSPPATFAKALGAEKLTLLGTMSAVRPTILLAEKGGVKTYYARGAGGAYEAIAAPKYPVIMRARIRLATGAANDPGQGVRVFYPAWSAKVLTGPTTTIIEGGT
jgi:hypothetical protein